MLTSASPGYRHRFCLRFIATLAVLAGFCTSPGCKGAAPLPAKAVELNRQGAAALEAGDLETADARFALALEYNPRFVEALCNQGLVELQRGNFRQARRLLAQRAASIRTSPNPTTDSACWRSVTGVPIALQALQRGTQGRPGVRSCASQLGPLVVCCGALRAQS